MAVGAGALGFTALGTADGAGSGRALGPGFGIGTGRDEPLGMGFGLGFGFAGGEPLPLGAGPGAGFGRTGPTLVPEFESSARGAARPQVAHATENPTTEINERTVIDDYHGLPRFAVPPARVLGELGQSTHHEPATGSGGPASAARARRLARCGLRLVMMPSFSSTKITG